MAETPKTPPFLAWGLYRERIGRTIAMEWRELGPVFIHSDGSGGFAHFKCLPCGWNHRVTFRRYGEGSPPLPVLRKAAAKPQPPPEDEEPDTLFSGDDAAEEPSEG